MVKLFLFACAYISNPVDYKCYEGIAIPNFISLQQCEAGIPRILSQFKRENKVWRIKKTHCVYNEKEGEV